MSDDMDCEPKLSGRKQASKPRALPVEGEADEEMNEGIAAAVAVPANACTTGLGIGSIRHV